VREACITIAFLSQQLGHKLNRFSETVLPALIGLIPNSAKVSGKQALFEVLRQNYARATFMPHWLATSKLQCQLRCQIHELNIYIISI